MVPDKYNRHNFLKALHNPKLLLNESARIRSTLERKLNKLQLNIRLGGRTNFFEQDWDNLVILDACRYDVFEQINTIDGNLSYRISKGSHSEEFYRKSTSQKEYYDTIIVTANPYSATIASDSFYKIETTFSGKEFIQDNSRIDQVKVDGNRIIEASHIDNVHPRQINQIAKDVHNKFPNKRLILHYMQPHAPYIGDIAEEMRESFEESGYKFKYWSNLTNLEENSKTVNNLLALAMDGLLSSEDLRRVYRENLRIVLKYVSDIISHIGGKSIVTADHGELLGDGSGSRKWGHSHNLYIEELRKVPWLEIENGPRRETTEEPPVQTNQILSEDVNNQLKMLGYK